MLPGPQERIRPAYYKIGAGESSLVKLFFVSSVTPYPSSRRNIPEHTHLQQLSSEKFKYCINGVLIVGDGRNRKFPAFHSLANV